MEPADHRREAGDAALLALAEAADLLVELVVEGARTIVFMKSRKAVELIARFAVLELENRGRPDLAERIAPYRRPHAQQRRELERRLVEGELLGVVSTNALELGIDIGSLERRDLRDLPRHGRLAAAVWPRGGAAGRGLAVYVAGEDALDQFFCRHPDEFLDRPVEAAILDPRNEQIHAAHLLCAAHEGPLEPADGATLGEGWEDMAETLVATGDLRRRPDGTFVPQRTDGYPAADVALRSASRDGVVIVDGGSGEILGTRRPRPRALDRPRGATTSTAAASSRSRSSTSTPAARSSSRSRATGTRSPSARPTPTSSA